MQHLLRHKKDKFPSSQQKRVILTSRMTLHFMIHFFTLLFTVDQQEGIALVELEEGFAEGDRPAIDFSIEL